MSGAEPEKRSSGDRADRVCDFCNQSEALLYCRADSAKLCFSCDREVHSTNQLFKKHNRSLLCDSCDSSPSSIFCCSESAVLCQNCDWEAHQNFGSAHYRRPVEGFSGCPSVSELLGFLGLEDLGKKSLDLGGGNDEGLLDLFVWDTPSIVTLDELIVSSGCDESAPGFQAMGVPPLPKNRNASCGKHEDEIFSQLHKMAKRDSSFSGFLEDFEAQVDIESQVPARCLREGGNKGSKVEWCFADECFPSTLFQDLSGSDANGFQERQSCLPVDSKAFQLNSQERGSAISRYKEKKARRHVRYKSRRVRAESRVRRKGRFAKMGH